MLLIDCDKYCEGNKRDGKMENREGKEQLGRILNQVTREALCEEVMSLKPEGRTSFITMSVSKCRDTGT